MGSKFVVGVVGVRSWTDYSTIHTTFQAPELATGVMKVLDFAYAYCILYVHGMAYLVPSRTRTTVQRRYDILEYPYAYLEVCLRMYVYTRVSYMHSGDMNLALYMEYEVPGTGEYVVLACICHVMLHRTSPSIMNYEIWFDV